MTARGVSDIHENDIHNYEYHLSVWVVYLIHHEVRSCSIWLVLIGSHKMKDATHAVAMQLFWYPSNIYCIMTVAVYLLVTTITSQYFSVYEIVRIWISNQ